MPKQNLIGGEWRGSDDVMEVRFPYDGSLVDAVSMASAADMNDAMDAALEGFEMTRKLPSHKRSQILQNMVRLLRERFDEVVDAMIMEGGKNRKTAVGETIARAGNPEGVQRRGAADRWRGFQHRLDSGRRESAGIHPPSASRYPCLASRHSIIRSIWHVTRSDRRSRSAIRSSSNRRKRHRSRQ